MTPFSKFAVVNCILLGFLAVLPAAAQTTERVSVASDGAQGNNSSQWPAISADGRFAAFFSYANNLVTGDTNNDADVFVHDRATSVTERVSVASDGTQGNGLSSQAAISADGRFVAFSSTADNLVTGDTNNTWDAFVYDRATGVTERVSVASDGTQGNLFSFASAISADGRFAAFFSYANNLVTGDTNNAWEVFVHDRATSVTERVSVASDGTQARGFSESPAISADGRFVAFTSYADNLITEDTSTHPEVFVHDRPGRPRKPGIFVHERPTEVTADTNNTNDVFVHDRATGATERVSVASDGAQGNGGSFLPSLSADGRFVAFPSSATNLVAGDTNGVEDVFVHDRATGVTERVSVASDGTQGNSFTPVFALAISADGRFVAFTSGADNLVIGDTNTTDDVFVHDRATGVTERVSVASDGTQQGNSFSHIFGSAISDDGRFVAFASGSDNLATGDTNNAADVFVRDRGALDLLVFGGLEPPLKDLPFTNSAKAGRTIPIKWQVLDENDDYVSDLAIVQSLQFAPVACDSQDIDYENPIGAEGAGNSGLRYDAKKRHFIFNWKTSKSLQRTCAVFILTLADGQEHFARFMLK